MCRCATYCVWLVGLAGMNSWRRAIPRGFLDIENPSRPWFDSYSVSGFPDNRLAGWGRRSSSEDYRSTANVFSSGVPFAFVISDEDGDGDEMGM